MKKRFLYLALATIALVSCRKDEIEIVPEPNIETQNTYDDQAAQDFLQTHYLDSKGVLKNYVATDTANVKLADLIPAPVTLPSGVIYIVRAGAQPSPGTPIGEFDLMRIMTRATSYVAVNADNVVKFQGGAPFVDNISGSGTPEVDPLYYYAKKSIRDNATNPIAKERSFYEIEGFQEAVKKFKAFDIPDVSNFNLQGVIIVPSRAAFARDPNYFAIRANDFRNRSFVFNFQIYKTTPYGSER